MYDPISRSNFTIQFHYPILRSNFPIQFSDPFVQSNFSIQLYDPFVRSHFLIQIVDPIFRLAGQPNMQPASWQAGRRSRSASQQTATQPASQPPSQPCSQSPTGDCGSSSISHLGKLKGENMFTSYFPRMPHVTDAHKACLAEIRQADRSRKI